MNKILFLGLSGTPLALFAGVMNLQTDISTSIATNLGAYCNGAGAYNSPIPASCTTVDFGSLSANTPYFPCTDGGAAAGYCTDHVTFTSNTVGGETLSATDGGSGDEFTLTNTGDSQYTLSYYVTYQSCQSSAINQKIGSSPLTIPMDQAAEFPVTGSGATPCTCNGSTCQGTPGQGQGALYFYVNDGEPINTPLAAGTYAGTLTITQSAN